MDLVARGRGRASGVLLKGLLLAMLLALFGSVFVVAYCAYMP
jgi:hypothetical protein